MSLIATYNGVTISPLLAWSKATSVVPTFDGKRIMVYSVTYTIRGFFNNLNAGDRKTDFDSLISKFNENGATLQIVQDTVVIEELKPADVVGDEPHAMFAVPDHLSDRLKMGFNVPFVLTITGTRDAQGAGPVLAHSFVVTTSDDKEAITTRTQRGQFKVAIGGGGASAQLAGLLPAIPSGFERERLETTVDDEDLVIEYTVVDKEKPTGGQNNTTADDLTFTTGLTIEDGTETWTLAGELRYGPTKTPNKGDVKTLRAQEFPSGVRVIQENVEVNPRENTLRFTVVGERGYGQQGTLEYENVVTTQSRRTIRDFKAISPQGQDVRQELARPEHVIVQSGRRVSTGGYGSFPIKVGVAADEIERVEEQGDIFYDLAGRGARFPIRWSYTFRPLNRVAAGSLAPAQANQPTDPQTGQSSGSKASV